MPGEPAEEPCVVAGGSLTNNEPPMIEDICAQAAGTLQPSVTYTDQFGKESNCGEIAAWFASPCNDYTHGGMTNADGILAMFGTPGTGEAMCCSGSQASEFRAACVRRGRLVDILNFQSLRFRFFVIAFGRWNWRNCCKDL